MAITPLTVTIDLNPSYKKIPAVYVSQLDNNLRSLAITVKDGGVNYDVASSGYDVYVEGTKPDKHGFSYKVTDIGGTVVGSVVTVPMQTQMTCVQGMVPTEIVLKSNADRIGSANFLLVVERAGLAEDVDVSETDIPAYIDGAQQAAAAAAQSADDAEDAKDLAVAAKDTAVSVAASIPEDYTTLSNDVDDLKSAINGYVSENFIEGKNLDTTGAIIDDSTTCITEKIPYTWTGSTRYYFGDGSAYKYRVCFYDANDTLLAQWRMPANIGTTIYRSINAEEQVTGTVAYVRFSFIKDFVGYCVKNQNPEPTPYWVASSENVTGLTERVSNLESDKLSIADMTYSTTAATLATGTTLEIATDVDSRKNDAIDFRADITSFTSVTVGHGYMINHGVWITVDATNITMYDDSDGGQVAQKAHGLTISDYIHVLINRKKDSTVDIEVMTGTGSYTWNTNWFGNRGSVFAFCNGTLTSVRLNAIFRDLDKLIYMFGDSYQSFLSTARYPYYLVQNEFNDYLAVGFPGAAAGHGIAAFRAILAKAKPKYVVWALGMNGSDSETAINSLWKEYTDEVIATCDANNITLILTTTPNVPERIQTFKNDYVRNSGKRYIDFAKAVGAESQGSTWYTGMLSSDNVHPTDLGAKALYTQLLADFPEIMR